MNPIDKFNSERKKTTARMARDKRLAKHTHDFLKRSFIHKYSYNFDWMGRPIIQYPQDIVAMQEIIWRVKPDLIIETGIARGGSLIFYASMLELLGRGTVLGIDVDIRAHNRREIEKHPMYKRIKMIEGSSTDERTLAQVRSTAKRHKRVLVCLDSLHTGAHVLKELELYAPLVSKGSYCVVFDTLIEELPNTFWRERSWGKGDNPKTAVDSFLRKNKNFVVDKKFDKKLLITVARGGYLKRVQ